MPDPLAIPLIRTVPPPSSAVRVAPFGNVSVVMIPRAASSHRSAASASCRPGNAAVIL